MNYLLHILILVGIYATLAYSLDLLVGHTGLLSLAQAAFYGLGAYVSGLLAVNFGAPFMVGALAGAASATMLSFLVSLPSLRLRGDYFIIATFGFQMIVFSIFSNWIEVTRGPLGIADIPPPAILGWSISTTSGVAALSCALAALACVLVSQVARSPFGRVLRAIREDEIFAEALGKSTFRFKILAFALSGGVAGCAGALYAHYFTYIDPTSFTAMESVLVLAMVIVGGAGSKWGPLLGAAMLVILPEALRFLGLPIGVASNLRQVFYGSLLVVMMVFRPQGLVGRYRLGR